MLLIKIIMNEWNSPLRGINGARVIKPDYFFRITCINSPNHTSKNQILTKSLQHLKPEQSQVVLLAEEVAVASVVLNNNFLKYNESNVRCKNMLMIHLC